jgi:hypothetical protein
MEKIKFGMLVGLEWFLTNKLAKMIITNSKASLVL